MRARHPRQARGGPNVRMSGVFCPWRGFSEAARPATSSPARQLKDFPAARLCVRLAAVVACLWLNLAVALRQRERYRADSHKQKQIKCAPK